MTETSDLFTLIFPHCRRLLKRDAWERSLAAVTNKRPTAFVPYLESISGQGKIPAWLPDLARLELNYHEFTANPGPIPETPETRMVNPALVLLRLNWEGLPRLLNNGDSNPGEYLREKESHVLIWQDPGTRQFCCRDALPDDLLALKLVVDDMDIKSAAVQGGTPPGQVAAVLQQAVSNALILAPKPGIARDPGRFAPGLTDPSVLASDVFTLQWHITQACDLHCRHCYDRSDRIRLSLAEAERVLNDFFGFTQAMNIRGHVTFTGGNPLLYTDFPALYQKAADLGFSLAILGNPVDAGMLDTLLAISPMTHYQISLEGLAPYNDYIRGKGHFRRSLAFLDTLREKGIYSMVMLTLNRDNIDQVLPLAEVLQDRAESFTFNRLAMVGEGENLRLPEPERFQTFLRQYLAALPSYPMLSLKDNLFNIIRSEAGDELTGGCTGHGCGAAFNFVSLLPDGEVHACRKFPSLIGNIKENSLLDIYQSAQAHAYRGGAKTCLGCDLFSVCRGCPAVVFGMGLDCFETRDPFCFYADAPDRKGS